MDRAWVTLATNDDYALGALSLARSIKVTESAYNLVVFVCDLSQGRLDALRNEFDVVEMVQPIASHPHYNDRPELGVTLTKLNCWTLTQYEKCVFLDADTLLLQNCDNLFEWDELSAAPDIGWPDCFNSGVFVFKPCLDTYNKLMKFFCEKNSFDGADQGLLNAYFSDWFMKPECRLSFVYNTAISTAYFYVSAFKRFERDIKILHFLGGTKPWHMQYDESRKVLVDVPSAYAHAIKYLDYWWRLQMQKPNNAVENVGEITETRPPELEEAAVEHARRPSYESWQSGQMDFMGIDSFSNIKSKLDSTIEPNGKKLNLLMEDDNVSPEINEMPNTDLKKDNTVNDEVKDCVPQPDYEAWQVGQMDYMGVDSFWNIKTKLDAVVNKQEEKPKKEKEEVTIDKDKQESEVVEYTGPIPDYQAWQYGQIDYLGINSFEHIKTRLDYIVNQRHTSIPDSVENEPSVSESESEEIDVVYNGPYPDYEAWQRGQIDYMGIDSFANIQLRNSDTSSNYVDRVRIRDPAKQTTFDGPGRGSGWRQKSLSNIDLTANHRANGVFRYRDFDGQLCDLYSKNSDCAEYDDLYGVNPKVSAGSCKKDTYDQQEACSLRRSRSLAIIREETFNDLKVHGQRRRSQLIPRARLVDRNFFRDRYNFIYDESISGRETLTSEICPDTESCSSKRRYRNKAQPPYPWQQDKSDLESIDSSIFKYSAHQNGLERPNSIQSSCRKHLVSRVEVHENRAEPKPRTNLDADIRLLEKISIADGYKGSPKPSSAGRYSESSDYTIKDEDGSGITVIEIKAGKNPKASSVISYDSIYLSSESGESKQTVFEDPNCAAHLETEKDLIAISIEVYADPTSSEFGEETEESIIDTLYSQVTKKVEKETEETNKTDTLRSEFQYSSLPDAGAGNILRKSEKIDAKLRVSYRENTPLEEPLPDYDTVKRAKTELLVINSGPSSIEESEKGAPSIELIQPQTRELEQEGSTKIFLQDLGLEIDYENSVISDPDSDIVSIGPPPSVTLGGKQVIVDEVAAKAIKRSGSFTKDDNIYDEVIDLENQNQNNLVRAEKIEIQENGTIKRAREKLKTPKDETEEEPPKVFTSFRESFNRKVEANFTDKTVNLPRKSSLKVTKEINQELVPENEDISENEETLEIIETERNEEEVDDKPLTVIKVTTFERRGSESRQQRPLRAAANALKIATFSTLIKEAAEKMPRPQLLQIVDKRPVSGSDKDAAEQTSCKAEFQHKVDSVRSYWSKILEEVQQAEHDFKSVSEEEENASTCSRRDSIETQNSSYFTAQSTTSKDNDDFQSFMPTVEIVELDGQKKAAIVKAKNFDEVDFDHVRYRVIKSDVFQKRILINHRKEAQFDGLLQYLQDYSFQELLANNNVVIIEPVRTKIEKPCDKPPLNHSIHCKITGGAGGHKKGKLPSHFFYHPVRVNKELLDEELPSPDTVRNVRRMFEHRFGLSKGASQDDSKLTVRNTENLRKKALRYLSIDTSFGNNGKWDSASLSSGVSSGDLSSPCECNDQQQQQKYCSEEHLCTNNDDEEFETHYVSQDILEKIRERGSSVTYYGGRVVKKGGQVSAMTKALMNEIHRNTGKAFKANNSEYMGMKFKLIKSNSCSSRLELAGTGRISPEMDRNISVSPETVKEEEEELEETPEPEESVRDIVSKLEHRSMSDLSISSKSSAAIEPTIQPSKRLQQRFDKIERAKVCRNRDVDLAFNGQPIVSKEVTFAEPIRTERPEPVRKLIMESTLEPIAQSPISDQDSPKNYDSLDSDTDDDTLVYTIGNSQTVPKPAMLITNPEPTDASKNEDQPSKKVVSWTTLGKFDEKLYCVNDKKLIEKPKYDEMEFEEFEVYDPSAHKSQDEAEEDESTNDASKKYGPALNSADYE